MVFCALLLIPLLVFICGFFLSQRITWREFGVQVAIQAVIVGIITLIVSCTSMSDVEVWNGYVIDKQKVIVSCSHSYSCFCVNSCDKDNNCTQICQTCYEHSNDYDWDV